MTTLEHGDPVEWNTSQGPTRGRVVGRVTRTTRIKGYAAQASPSHPEVEVSSDKSGAHAVHRAGALRKVR